MEGKEFLEKSPATQFYIQVIKSITDPLVVLDNDFCYKYLNPAAESILGNKVEYLNGKNIWNSFPFLYGSLFKSFCEKSLQKQRSHFLEEYYETYDVWTEYRIYPNAEGLVILFKDISLRKKAEFDTLKLIKRNALLIDTMRDMFLLVDEDLNVVDVNNAYCNAMGYSKAEMVQMNMFDFAYKYSKTELLELLEKAITDSVTLVDFVIITKNEEIINVEVAAVEMIIEGRKHFATFGRDITAFEKALVLLEKNNARFELIGAATHEALWEVEIETKIRWANEVHQKMYGLSKFHPVPDSKAWEDRIHPEVRESVKRSLQEAISNKQVAWTKEYLFLTETIGWINIYDRTHIIYDSEGKALRMLGSMTNITDLKKAENAIITEKNLSDSIINSLPGIFYLINREGKFLRWNTNFEKVSKYNYEELSNIYALNLYHENEQELIKQKIQEVFEKGESEIETLLYTKDKEKIPFYLNGKLTVKNGEKCLIGMGVDMTVIKKTEKAMHEMEQQILIQKVQEHKKIARAIITTQEKERNYIGAELHDNVNQLLAGARLYLNIGGKSSSQVKEAINYPLQLIDKAIQEIRNLTSRHVTPVKNADLEPLIQSLVVNLKHTTNIQARLVCDADESAIPADLKINIYRILQELVNNTIKHAICKNVFINLTCQDNHIILLVEDDGKGFCHNKKSEGIGLTNIINRVNSFNGEISIQSEPGKGCSTRIKLPFHEHQLPSAF